MLQFITGFVVGVWVGTHYNCKPHIEQASKYIKDNMPKPKE
jgi:hypothetical protein